MRYLTAVSVIALLSTSAATAQQFWTQEEITAGVKRIEFTRFVPAGKSRTLENVTIINPDCTIAAATEVTITKEPEHGSATIDAAEGFLSYGKDNPRSSLQRQEDQRPRPELQAGPWLCRDGCP